MVSPRMGEHGWPFAKSDAFAGAGDDPHEGASFVKDLYLRADPDFVGRFTVPVLWDTHHRTIVNNESSEIIRFLNTAFNHLLPADNAGLDLYPEPHRKEIDEINDWVYTTVNSLYPRIERVRSEDAHGDICIQMACTRLGLRRRRMHTRTP